MACFSFMWHLAKMKQDTFFSKTPLKSSKNYFVFQMVIFFLHIPIDVRLKFGGFFTKFMKFHIFVASLLSSKQERLPSSKFGPCASVWGQPSHYLFISLAWHSSASACFQYSIYHVFVSLNSDLQAEIWLSIVDLGPIIPLLQSLIF